MPDLTISEPVLGEVVISQVSEYGKVNKTLPVGVEHVGWVVRAIEGAIGPFGMGLI
jgi:hypothetical protein